MNAEQLRLSVELFLAGATVRGFCQLAYERQRLVDVLSSMEDTFELESACITLSSAASQQVPLLTVEKPSIRMAIPHETPGQARHRAMVRTLVGRTETAAIAVTVLLPPFIVAGKAHLPKGVRALRGRLRADPDIFGRFFPVTDAELTLSDGSRSDLPVVLLNRDRVAAISLAQERRLDAAI